MAGIGDRKRRGAWYTPDDLVSLIVDEVVSDRFVTRQASTRDRDAGPPVRVVDPSCGDGRFLRAAAHRILVLGGSAHLVGVDIDQGAVAATRRALEHVGGAEGAEGAEGASNVGNGSVTFEVIHADALSMDWTVFPSFDLVIGNPPFLSQMAAATTRGGSSSRGGGPYADAAVEFLALAAEVVAPDGGRVAFVLPQSLLAARDAGAIRERYDGCAELFWSWWTGEKVFDAQVHTCALAFEFGRLGSVAADLSLTSWSHVVTSRRGVPDVPAAMGEQKCGTLGDRARLNANFRDEYYGMVGAVGDHVQGPKLITSGLIDPGRSLWGERPIRFAKQRFLRPRIDLAALDGKMPKWARDRLVPKVLIANQTKIIEAFADPAGSTLPGVPVVSAYPLEPGAGQDVGSEGHEHGFRAWEIAAVLTSPIASAWAWHRSAGTGLSADAIRLGPVLLAAMPWPAGNLDEAILALQAGDVRACAALVHSAFGLHANSVESADLFAWWLSALERIEARQPEQVRRRERGFTSGTARMNQ